MLSVLLKDLRVRGAYSVAFLDSGTINHGIREWNTQLDDVGAALLHGEHDGHGVGTGGVSCRYKCYECGLALDSMVSTLRTGFWKACLGLFGLENFLEGVHGGDY